MQLFLHYPPNFKLISSIVELFLFCAFSYHREPYRSVLFWARGDSGRDKKDAESSKTASSPYWRTAETVFGGRKSENVKSYAGIRQDSDSLPAIYDILKINYHSPFSLFRSALFSRPESGRDKKDAEASKIVTSPYKRTAEAIFGGRKSG